MVNDLEEECREMTTTTRIGRSIEIAQNYPSL
jgi:hypothetical protein